MNELRKRFETPVAVGEKVYSKANERLTNSNGPDSHRKMNDKPLVKLMDATCPDSDWKVNSKASVEHIETDLTSDRKVISKTSAEHIDTGLPFDGKVISKTSDDLIKTIDSESDRRVNGKASLVLTDKTSPDALLDTGKRKPTVAFKDIIKLPSPKLAHTAIDSQADGRSDGTDSSEYLPRGLPVHLSPSIPNGPSGKRFLGSKGRSLSDTSRMFRGSFDSGLDKQDKPMLKTGSLNIEDPDEAGLRRNPYSSSIKRRTLKRRSSKRFEKTEEKKPYGNDTETYETIRERVLQEKAVVNAIEALQERWRMIMFMYSDSVDMNAGRIERQQTKLTVKRQEELILLLGIFLLFCLPVMVLCLIVCKL